MTDHDIPERFRGTPHEKAWLQGRADAQAAGGCSPTRILLVAGVVGVGIWLWSAGEIDWTSLVFIAMGVLLGYTFGVDRSARRRSSALLRSLSVKMFQLAESTASGAAESEAEEMFTLGQAKAFELVATELNTMADKIG